MSRVALVVELGGAVLDLSGAQIAAITLDAEGAVVIERGRQPYRTVAVPAEQARTAGAGDTYLAALSLALASGAGAGDAAEIAARAGAVVVGRDGTAACTDADLRHEIDLAVGICSEYGRASVVGGAPAEIVIHGEGDGSVTPPTWESARRLLCIRLDSLGDVLMMTPSDPGAKTGAPDATSRC